MSELDKFHISLATELGVSIVELPVHVIENAINDPLYLHHLVSCKSDIFMLHILFKEAIQSTHKVNVKELNKSKIFRHATSSAIKWLSFGAKFTDEVEYQKRRQACFSCPNISIAPKYKLYRLLKTHYVCRLCGCDIDRKAKLDTEACPDKKYSEKGRWVL